MIFLLKWIHDLSWIKGHGYPPILGSFPKAILAFHRLLRCGWLVRHALLFRHLYGELWSSIWGLSSRLEGILYTISRLWLPWAGGSLFELGWNNSNRRCFWDHSGFVVILEHWRLDLSFFKFSIFLYFIIITVFLAFFRRILISKVIDWAWNPVLGALDIRKFHDGFDALNTLVGIFVCGLFEDNLRIYALWIYFKGRSLWERFWLFRIGNN